LNQYCSEPPLKILFQQYRPGADIGARAIALPDGAECQGAASGWWPKYPLRLALIA
jgi:hypothetical protein